MTSRVSRSSTGSPDSRKTDTQVNTKTLQELKDVSITNSQELHEAVARAMKLAHGGRLITYDDLPVPWRINPYIRRGYRFTGSVLSALQTPVCISNELVNVWTHFAPALVLLWYLFYGLPIFETFQHGGLGRREDALVAGFYMSCAIGSLLCSSVWHTFRCIAKLRLMAGFICVDIMAISLILSAFNILTAHVVFYTQPQLRHAYLLSDLVWCVVGLVLPWTNLFGPREITMLKVRIPSWWTLSRGWNRVIFFTGLGAQGLLVPMMHSAIINGWGITWQVYGLAIWVMTPMALGGLVYGSKFPEKNWPGYFDFCGCSHNIWHVVTAFAAVTGCRIMRGMFEVAWARAAASV